MYQITLKHIKQYTKEFHCFESVSFLPPSFFLLQSDTLISLWPLHITVLIREKIYKRKQLIFLTYELYQELS